MTNEDLMEEGGEEGDHIQHPEIQTTPITPDAVADPEALEATRKELLERSKKIVKVTASVLQDKMDTERDSYAIIYVAPGSVGRRVVASILI
jgi:hypothetical protein